MSSVDLERPFRDIQRSKDLKDLVHRVFLVFSRFEFALKRSGFASQSRNRLDVKRKELAKKHSNSPLPSPLPEDLSHLIENPPRRQKFEDGCLGWQEREVAPKNLTLEWLLDAAYIVRNNLFHGGKWTSLQEPATDEKLLRAALAVIKLALELDKDLCRYYME